MLLSLLPILFTFTKEGVMLTSPKPKQPLMQLLVPLESPWWVGVNQGRRMMFRPITEFWISNNFLIKDTIKSKLKICKKIGVCSGWTFCTIWKPLMWKKHFEKMLVVWCLYNTLKYIVEECNNKQNGRWTRHHHDTRALPT
jgi:hypothetical protein